MEKADKVRFFDALAGIWDFYKRRNWYYHRHIEQFLKLLIPNGKKVLEIGSASGNLLAALKPSKGLGIDFSPAMVSLAKKKHPQFRFEVMDAEHLRCSEKFDYIIMTDLIGHLSDVWKAFRELHKISDSNTTVGITYYNYLWQPLLKLAQLLRLKIPVKEQNWLYVEDVKNLLYINHFKVVHSGYRMLLPVYIPVLSTLLNKYIAQLPLVRRLCLVQYVVARKEPAPVLPKDWSVTILIPCRNEKGNIEDAVRRLPAFGSCQEILFVDGNSTDGTVEEIKRVIRTYPKKNIRLLLQGEGRGKGDAVRKGFQAASGDVLMILDADLTVPPEDLPKFYLALREGKATFVNGSRLVYPMEKEAMRYINLLGNWFFGRLFSWLIGQRLRDTLCGTKVLFRKDYLRLRSYTDYFYSMDPFGDFGLLFGASTMNLDIVEIPIRYKQRTYGITKIRRFYHGWILIKMSLLGMWKLKFR